MVAIKASFGTDAEKYYPHVLEWAPGVRSTEEEATRKVWDSITDIAVGWQWLVDTSGTGQQAQDEFAEAPPADSYATDPAEVAVKQMVEGWILSDAGFYEEATGHIISKDLFNGVHAHVAAYGLTGRTRKSGTRRRSFQLRRASGKIP
jgi:hypothetical protein